MKSLIGLSSNIVEITSQFEQTQKSLETVLQSAEKGKALFEDLRKFSFDTTFGVDELASASGQLLNVGVNVDKLQGQLKMLGDLAQGNKGKFQELVSIFAKVQSTGKVSSVQLNQFALRGVPVIQTLKDMGIQGATSAENLTKAFQKLTDKGGKFHDAMNNIIDTIEGKRGFIEDTIKEINVNMGELTGLTDLYKVSLDKIYDVYNAINEKLMEWNESPMMQAIIRGVIVGGITAIGTAIIASVVPALAKTIGQLQIILALKSAINPSTLLFGLGVSAVAGLSVAVATLVNKEKEVNEELETQIKNRQILGTLSPDSTVEEKSAYLTQLEEELSKYQGLQKTSVQKYTSGVFEGYFDTVKQYENLIKVEEKKLADLDARGIRKGSIEKSFNAKGKIEIKDTRNKDQIDYENTEKNLITLRQRYQELKKSWDDNTFYQNLEKNIESLKVMIEYQSTMEKNYKKIADYSPYATEEKQLEELKKQLLEVNDLYDDTGKKFMGLDKATGENKYEVDLLVNLDPSYKAKLDEAKKYLEKQKLETEIKISVAKLDDWQKVLKDAMDFTDKEVYEGFVDKGAVAVEKFGEKMTTELDRIKAYSDAGLINVSSLDLAQQKLNKVNKVIQAIRDSGKWEANEGTVDDLKALQAEALLGVYNAQNESLDKQLAILQGQTTELEQQQALQKQSLMESGYTSEQADSLIAKEKQISDLKLKQTDAWGYLNQQVTEHLTGIGISEQNAKLFSDTILDITKTQLPNTLIDGFDAIGTALATGADAGEAMKKQFVSFVAQMMKSLSVTCIQAGVNLIAQSGWAGVPPALALFALGGVSGITSGFLGSLNQSATESNEQQKQLEQLKALTKSYEDLNKAIREQENYYLKKKSELNAWTLKDYVSNVTPVNDMILTPHGTFSTHPEDTIIATKKPEGLGGANVKVTVNNYSNSKVDVTEKQNADGMKELLVTISQKVASDVASGRNGWDSALTAQQQRISGRRI